MARLAVDVLDKNRKVIDTKVFSEGTARNLAKTWPDKYQISKSPDGEVAEVEIISPQADKKKVSPPASPADTKEAVEEPEEKEENPEEEKRPEAKEEAPKKTAKKGRKPKKIK